MKIGFIGLGIMGEPMSSNIVKKHRDTVYVFDTVRAKMNTLESVGAVPCESAAALARAADIIISMVPKSEHSRAVYAEIAGQLDRTKICIDMSTIDPQASKEIAFMVKKTGAEFLDAPVVKSRQAAMEGTLGIYVGGSAGMFEKILPILHYMGKNIKYMGENGNGLIMKICHNALVSQIQNGVNETLALAAKNGIGVADFAEAVSYGGGQNFYLDSKKEQIGKEDFTTAFSVENMAKDIGICLKLASESQLKMPGEEAAYRVYERALALGYGGMDFCSTIKLMGD